MCRCVCVLKGLRYEVIAVSLTLEAVSKKTANTELQIKHFGALYIMKATLNASEL